VVFIESTADGHEGHFYDLCEAAQAKQRMGAPLTPLDFRFGFYAWHRAPEYQLDAAGIVIGEDFRRYFNTLQETLLLGLRFRGPTRCGLESRVRHYVPHDIQAREWTNGLTRIEQMLREVYKRHLGKFVQKVPMHMVDDGINAVRQLRHLQFDAGPTAEGVKALKNYRSGPPRSH
jgi:hypothetical protein